MKPSITFFGTHEFGAGMLRALIDSNAYDIVAVVTQPDRPVGRHQELQESPVKQLAKKHNLNVLQPESLKTFNFSPLTFNLSVVCQYGLIIPQSILDLPKHGTLNIHTSLLPKYRGASPIQSALINGETETGVTIMLMDAEMDHGAILSQSKIAIAPDDTAAELYEKMMPVAAKLIVDTIPGWLDGSIEAKEQDHTAATFCKMFTREDGKVDWSKSATEIYNLYRGLTPWPGIWTMWDGKRLKLLSLTPSPTRGGTEGGVYAQDNRLYISTGKGTIEVISIQLEGKKPMTAEEFLNGYKNFAGSTLG